MSRKTPRIPNPDSVGGRIRARRMQLRMTQSDLAALCFISPTELSGIELGMISPRVTTLTRIAQAMHSHPAELLGGSAPAPAALPAPSPLRGEGWGEGGKSRHMGYASGVDHATRTHQPKRERVPA